MAFEGLTEKLSSAFKKLRNKGRLTESDVKEAMREIRLALLEADVSYKVVKDFIKAVTEKAVGTEVLESLTPAQAIVKIVNQELVSLMGGGSAKITIASQPPTVVMMVGLQGAGKTTNAAKLAGLMRKQNGKRPLLAACDIYRPAAIQQLEVVGKQLDIPVFQMGQENPVTIAEAAIAHAKKHGNDMVFLDTAGRLHVDEALMEELQAIKQAVQPSEILLVVDAMIGQDAVNAAKAFDDALDIDGVVLTKLDGDARGGAALSIKAVTGKPIKFVGMGEKLDNIEVFHPDRMASRILGMGDVLTLIEKAEQQFDMQKAQELAEKLKKNRFTLQDYYDQLVQVKGMGGHDAWPQCQGSGGSHHQRKGAFPDRGYYSLYDTTGAGKSRHFEQQPEKADCRRLWFAGGGCEPSAERIWHDAADDQTNDQALRQAPERKIWEISWRASRSPLLGNLVGIRIRGSIDKNAIYLEVKEYG